MALDMQYFQEMEAKIPKGKVRTRFAPSPTGYMHIGNLRTALYTWLIARHQGGTFILRIEDTDQERLVEGATEVIYKTLRECGLTKRDVRMLSRDAGLFTWDKPAYACLATRIPTGQPITARDLAVTEAAESDLFSLGFTDFRVRMVGRSAKIQLPAAQMPRLLEHRQEILQRLGPDYDGVWLDLEGRG